MPLALLQPERQLRLQEQAPSTSERGSNACRSSPGPDPLPHKGHRHRPAQSLDPPIPVQVPHYAERLLRLCAACARPFPTFLVLSQTAMRFVLYRTHCCLFLEQPRLARSESRVSSYCIGFSGPRRPLRFAAIYELARRGLLGNLLPSWARGFVKIAKDDENRSCSEGRLVPPLSCS